MPPKRGRVQEPESESEETISDEEEEEFDLLAAMQAMDKHQRTKVYALKSIQKGYRDVQKEKFKEIAVLEQAFLEKSKVLMEQRRKIVCGELEPSAETVAKGVEQNASKVEEIESDDDAEKKPQRKGVKVTSPDEVAQKNDLDAAAAKADGGIPGFWLGAMKNCEMLEAELFERDEKALKFLTDVTVEFVDGDALKGFTLTFHFAPNPFFDNAVLTKTFVMDQDDDEPDTIDKMVGCAINWKSPEQKLTCVLKQKKQRHKSGGGVRVVTREEQCPSFFHFFSTVEEPQSDADEEELDEYSDRMNTDSTIGAAFRSQLIPRAVYYYNAKAIEEIAEQMQAMDVGDDGEFEDAEDVEEEEEEEPKPKKGKKGAAAGPAPKPGGKECKQQ